MRGDKCLYSTYEVQILSLRHVFVRANNFKSVVTLNMKTSGSNFLPNQKKRKVPCYTLTYLWFYAGLFYNLKMRDMTQQ